MAANRPDRGVSLAAIDAARLSDAASRAAEPQMGPQRRIRLWENAEQIHCSVLGTCASVEDLKRVARKVGIDVDPAASHYRIHGYFVAECTRDNAFSRAFHRLMDQRHAGAIRKVARTKDLDGLWALWLELREQGQIAGAYWAFMTHGHVPPAMRTAIYGDVHMLSHLAGASYRRRTIEAVSLRDRLQEAEDRARRVEAGLHEALQQRAAEIDRLRKENADLRAAGDRQRPTVPDRHTGKAARQLEKLERALIAARVRARDAEARCKALEERSPPILPQRDDTGRDGPATAPATAEPLTANGRAVLYLGGRSGTIDHLRRIAAEHDARFVHHDGGLEDGVQRLDSLLPSVDCVLCPIDCVSHDACLRAKRVCKTLGKPFLTLRSASQASFRAALRRVAAKPGEPT